MSLFLIAGVPLTFLTLVTAITRVRENAWQIGGSFLRGIAIYLVMLPVYLVLESFIHVEYTPSRVFLYYFVFHTFFHAFIATAGYVLLERTKKIDDDDLRFPALIAFVTGIYFLQPALDIILLRHQLNAYLLFLLPCMRIILTIVFASIVFFFEDHSPALRMLSILAVPALATLLTFIPFLYVRSYISAAAVLTACMAILSAGILFMVIRLRLR